MDIVSFITAYFASKKLSMITAFICWTPAQVTDLWRSASISGLRFSVHQDFSSLPEMSPSGILREGMLLDVSCPDYSLVLEKASSSRAFNYRFSWLLLHNSSLGAVIDDSLARSSILPDADVVWSSPDSLIDVYRVKSDQPFLLSTLGLTRNCSAKELEALWSALPTPVTRRKDLRGARLKAAVVIGEPQNFKGWSDLSARQIDTFPKVTHPLMMLTAQDMNYRLNIMQVDFYGVSHNGTFDGLAGLLQRQRVEVGLNSVFMRSDRIHVMHFCAETLLLTGAFLFRQPSRSAVSNVFLLPFSDGVWAACGVVTALAALQLMLVFWLRHRLPHADSKLSQLTLSETCTFALGTLRQQGFHVIPPMTSVRLAIFFTLLQPLFAFTAYSAKIVAILQTPSHAIKSLDDLIHSPMTLGIQETTYKKVYFAESTNPVIQHLYRRKLQPQGERAFYSVVDGIEKVRTGLFAFQVERSAGFDVIARTFTEREKCGLHELEAFKLPVVAVPLRRHSGYRELFATRLRWQREVGLMQQAQRVWLSEAPRCETDSGGFVSVGLTDVLPAIQVLCLGAGVALLLLLGELATATRHKMRRRTQRSLTLAFCTCSLGALGHRP